MKSAYMICALLVVTIGTLVLADNNMIRTTAQALNSTVPPSSAAESSKNIADSGSNTISTTSAVPLKVNDTNTLTAIPNTSTVINPTTTASITTTNTTTTTTNATTVAPTTTPTPNNTITTESTTTSITTSKPPKPTSPPPAPTATPTDAVKTTTAIPSPSKDRQFDGLSFFGGIILTTCLMAIAAFSWRFYRQCKEGNYRTL